MCGQIFREAILFYKDGKVVSHLNICFSCDWIETDKQVAIETDNKVFPKLREFFKHIGHLVEEK